MANLTIKNIPDPLVRRLKAQAVRCGRSLNLEIISRLEEATRSAPADPDAVLAHVRAVRPMLKGVRLNNRLLARLKHGRP